MIQACTAILPHSMLYILCSGHMYKRFNGLGRFHMAAEPQHNFVLFCAQLQPASAGHMAAGCMLPCARYGLAMSLVQARCSCHPAVSILRGHLRSCTCRLGRAGRHLRDRRAPDGSSSESPCQADSVVTVAVGQEVLLALGAGESKPIHNEPGACRHGTNKQQQAGTLDLTGRSSCDHAADAGAQHIMYTWTCHCDGTAECCSAVEVLLSVVC